MNWKRTLSFAVVAIVMVGAYPARYLYREHKVEKFFWNMHKESPKADVLRALGSPDSVGACGKWLWWGDDANNLGENQGQCVEMVRYNFFLHAYAFGFASDGRAVSKYHYQSE